jgi:hypothetical protein
MSIREVVVEMNMVVLVVMRMVLVVSNIISSGGDARRQHLWEQKRNCLKLRFSTNSTLE